MFRMLSDALTHDRASAEEPSTLAVAWTARKQADNKADFEELLAVLSSCFINLPPGQVDAEIPKAQRAVCRFFRLERSALWQLLSQDSGMIQLTHLHHEPQQGPAMAERIAPEDMPEEAWRIQMPVGTAGFVAMDGDKLFPWITRQFRDNQTIIITRLEDLPPEAAADMEFLRHYGTRSSVMIPLMDGSVVIGAITFATLYEERAWPEAVLKRLQVVARLFAHAIARQRMDQMLCDSAARLRMAEEELRKKLHEIMELKTQLEREKHCLREDCNIHHEHSEIVGQSEAIQKIFQQIEQVAATDSHVLITGETGTGKELVARAIHAASRRNNRIMVKVNCATLPATLIESELFGREKGAYTGALAGQIGRFEMAHGGTIFLDEIGELSLELQVKLLRVLQEGEFERLGGPRTIRVNVRVIAATNRNLAEAVRKGEFRKDLFYRLSVFPIIVPPLRERVDDIPLLIWEFIDQFSQRMNKRIKSIPQKTMDRLSHYAWPGNIRELRNTIERAMILSPGDRLELQMPDDAEAVEPPVLPFKEAEQRLILEALQKAGGHIKGTRGAAALLGLKPSTLYTKMNKLGIEPHRQRDVKPT